MRKIDIARILASHTGMTARASQKAVNVVFDAVIEGIKKDRKVSVRGLGTWVVRRRKARRARVPKSSGREVHLPARDVAFFKASKNLYHELNPDGVSGRIE